MKRLLLRLLARMLRVSDLQRAQYIDFRDADGTHWYVDSWSMDQGWDLRAVITLRQVMDGHREMVRPSKYEAFR